MNKREFHCYCVDSVIVFFSGYCMYVATYHISTNDYGLVCMDNVYLTIFGCFSIQRIPNAHTYYSCTSPRA